MSGLRSQLLAIAGAAPSEHWINWRVETPSGFNSRFHRVDELDGLVELLDRLGARRTVYVGCAPRARRDGGRDAVERVECLWADCDNDESLARLEQFRPAPSLIVASGGITEQGARKLHAYWRLETRLDAETADDALKRLQRHLRSDARCAEPARVLRAVGSTWRKDGMARPVELVCADGGWHSLEVLLADVEPPPAPAPTPRMPAPRSSGGGSLDELEAALKQIPPPVYVSALTGQEPNSAGKIHCPFHEDWNPSFHVYPDARRGWCCFQCDNGQGRLVGGTIVDLAARLWQMDPRREYPALLRRLAHHLLGE